MGRMNHEINLSSRVAKRKFASLNHPHQLIDRLPGVGFQVGRIAIKFRVCLKVVSIEYLIRKIRLDQDIQIEIHVGENFTVKFRRHVHVAIEVSQFAAGLREPKHVVPAIKPVVFKTVGADRDGSQKIVNDLVDKLSIKDDQRALLTPDLRRPGPMQATVILVRAYENRLQG